MLGLTMALRCTNHGELNRIHLYQLYFCAGHCARQVRDALAGDEDKRLLLIPLTTDAIASSPEIARDIRKRVMALPAQTTGAVCANCTARCWDTEPAFKMCAACADVRYCSKECQREHWRAEHREKCGTTSAVYSHDH